MINHNTLNTISDWSTVPRTPHTVKQRTPDFEGPIKGLLLRNTRYPMPLKRSVFCIHLAVAMSGKRRGGE